TPPEGARRLLLVLRTAPYLYPYLPLLRRAVDISSAMRVGVYDCLYVALAEREVFCLSRIWKNPRCGLV
ncbi:MAG TPA: hypothetical protein VG099_16180, partial [Gemmataceae bacterium]|nr:hypothetical protein [Gemmataceae bacterium]